MTRARLAALALTALLAAPARAGFELRSEVGVSLQATDRFRLGLEQELRLDHGAREVDAVRPAVWASWRAARWLSLRLGYRYDIEPHVTKGADYADGWHEGWLDVTLRRRLEPVRLALRLRLEERWGRPWEADGAEVRTHAARQRLELAWPFWREVALVGSGELFLRLADADGPLDEWRAGAALDVPLGAHEVSVRYLLERPLTAGREGAHVLGLSYRYDR